MYKFIRYESYPHLKHPFEKKNVSYVSENKRTMQKILVLHSMP